MGCCCAKAKEEQEEYGERSRLLGSGNDVGQKSRFVDPNQNGQLSSNYQRNQMNPSSMSNPNEMGNYNNQYNNSNQASSYQNYNLDNQFNNDSMLMNQNANENNQMFEKIMSEVIHVSAFEQRSYMNNDMTNQDMTFKLKGLLEPNRQQLMLPEGVPAPLSVLAAQPPFSNDIRLINNIAQEANACINNFSLQVPENVAFDFNPVA